MKHKLAVAALAAIALSFPTAIASAAPDPTTGVELNVPQDQFVHGPATANPGIGHTEGLKALKDLRAWAWDTNPLFRGYDFENFGPGTRLQDVARRNGITSKEAYTQIQADENLNWIAIQRAYEASKQFEHIRPDGSSPKTATRGSYQPYLESLAAGPSSLREAVYTQLGTNEIAILNTNGGIADGKTGHAVHLLHPRHKVWGFGRVSVKNTQYGNYVAAVNGLSLAKEDNTPSQEKEYTLHRAPVVGEKPNGVETTAPVPAPGGTSTDPIVVNPAPTPPAPVPGRPAPTQPDTNQSASSDFQTPATIIGSIIAALAFLGGLWGIIQQFLPRR